MAITVPNTFADKTGQVQLEALDENFSQIATDLDAEVAIIQADLDATVSGINSTVSNIEATVNGLEDPVAMGLLFGPDPQVDITSDLYYRLNSPYTPSTYTTGVFSTFNVGVTLASNTVYDFEYLLILSKSAGATSHTLGVSFGGTATLNNILYRGEGIADNSTIPVARINTTQTTFVSNSASNLVITAAFAVAGVYANFRIRGTVSVANGGTFIPQYVTSANPGGFYSTVTGSYIIFKELGQAGANLSSGVWS